MLGAAQPGYHGIVPTKLPPSAAASSPPTQARRCARRARRAHAACRQSTAATSAQSSSTIGTTRRNGTFEIRSLRPTCYEIRARPGDESAQFVEPLAGRVVDIAVGQTLDNVEIRVARGGVICRQGHRRRRRALHRNHGHAPSHGFQLSGSPPIAPRLSTNDLGQFRIYGLR